MVQNKLMPTGGSSKRKDEKKTSEDEKTPLLKDEEKGAVPESARDAASLDPSLDPETPPNPKGSKRS